MPATWPYKVHLYDANLTTPVYVADLTGRVDGLMHGTKLHGGFWDCRFQVLAGLEEFWDWFLNRLRYRVLIEDYAGKTVWEGRLEEVSYGNGRIHAQAYGYWRSLNDRVLALGSTKAYSAQTAQAIIKDILGNQAAISTDVTQVGNPAVNLTVTYADKTLWQAITNDQDGAANSTDASNNPWFFAVWENRKAAFAARSVSSITWRVRLSDLIDFPAIRAPYGGIYNSVSVTYLVSGTATRTGTANNGTSQTAYGQRDLAITGMGEANAATAQNRRARALQDLKDRRAEITGGIQIARLRDNRNNEYPPCRLRAGDVLLIEDLIPTSAGLATPSLDALRTYYVRETQCDHQRGIVTAYPDTGNQNLERLLAGSVRRPIA